MKSIRMFMWFVFLAFILFFLIRYAEHHSLYFPMKEVAATPALSGLSYEEVNFLAPDKKKLNGWFIPAEKARFTVLFSHGNAGNISHRLEKIIILRELGLNVFIFDYRGYGKSSGIPSEQGLYKDITASYDYLRRSRNISKDKLILYGESLGGAVAIDFAGKIEPAGLIIEGAFTSIKDMIKVAIPCVPYFFLSSRFDSAFKIKEVSCPKLIIHSIDDEVIPFYFGRQLFEAAASPKKFLEVRGAHNTAFLDSKEKYVQGIKSFVDGL